MSECAINADDWCYNHDSVRQIAEEVCDYARAEAAEAAMQRVREVVNPDAPMVPTRVVLRALDGGGE